MIRLQVILLIACCLTSVLLSSVYASAPVGETRDGNGGEASAAAGEKPVTLMLNWARSPQLEYTLTTGVKTAAGVYRGHQRVHYALKVQSLSEDGNAVAEYVRVAGEQSLAGEWRPFRGLGEMRVVFQVNPQGIVSDVVDVEAGDELVRWTQVSFHEFMLGSYVVGFPPADVTLGILNACVLPDNPLAVGSRWTRDISIPYASGPLPPIRFEGELTGLERKDQDTYAIIRSQMAIPGVDPMYVAEVTFSVTLGRAVSVEWQSLPGSPEGTFRRLSLDAS